MMHKSGQQNFTQLSEVIDEYNRLIAFVRASVFLMHIG